MLQFSKGVIEVYLKLLLLWCILPSFIESFVEPNDIKVLSIITRFLLLINFKEFCILVDEKLFGFELFALKFNQLILAQTQA